MSNKPIEILGKTFNSEEEAQKYYKTDLKKRLPELKEIEGFPIGEDEEILALSNPPFYTACPNPYINEFIEKYSKPYDKKTDDYRREPFVGDVSYGRNDNLLNAHFYHTKVPPKAIQDYINHYTDRGDIIIDGFAGTGTTGVAANRTKRNVILNDLSTIASFISYNQNVGCNVDTFLQKAVEILDNTYKEFSWVYDTEVKTVDHEINYTIISDVYSCNFCKNEFSFADEFVIFEENKIKNEVICTNCKAEITKNDITRVYERVYDEKLNYNIVFPKQKPFRISYKVGHRKRYKIPSLKDLELFKKVDELTFANWVPTSQIMFKGESWGDQWRAGYHKGYTNTHHFYTKRNLLILSEIFKKIIDTADIRLKHSLLFLFSSLYSRSHRMNRYIPKHGRHVGPLSGTLYISNLQVEINVFNILKDKIKSIKKAFSEIRNNNSMITCQSITDGFPNINSNTIDYIFTDPPFGDNLFYSELNFLMEDWMKVYTNNKSEAVISPSQNKDLSTYYDFMVKSFVSYYRVLKPNRWITIVFHNSKSSVWTAIQEAITKAGFIITNVEVLDKKKGTTKQLTYSGTVKNDLVISAYKPDIFFTENFIKNSGEYMEADFIQSFLSNQPIRPVIERTQQMLYSKMIAYYLQKGYDINQDAKSFYKLLRENFVEEDGFWFNAGQINSYVEHKKKMKLEGIDEIKQGAMMMFVTDEKSALVWLHNYLIEPKTFSDIHTAFTQLANIQGDEVPELMDLLVQNFISENGLYRRPKTDPEHNLVIEKREKQLMRQFESLLIQAQTEKKKIKSIRKEAVQLGFETCYKEKRFQDILTLASKLDRKILEESGELKEFVDAAEISIGGLS